jgi:hypothetical protein
MAEKRRVIFKFGPTMPIQVGQKQFLVFFFQRNCSCKSPRNRCLWRMLLVGIVSSKEIQNPTRRNYEMDLVCTLDKHGLVI